MTLSGLGVTMVILPCLCLLAAAQNQGSQPPASQVSKKIEKMRNAANINARALATAVQAEGIRSGKYNSVLSDYAKDLGGKLPINPCTGTRTGYTMTVSKKDTATVSASMGANCGKWTPKVFQLTL